MKFKDYKCRKCGSLKEVIFRDSESMPKVITSECEGCGQPTNMDITFLGGIVHLPPGAQAVPTTNIR